MFTAHTLAHAVPGVDVGRWLEPVNTACERFDINTPVRVAAFIGQCAYESAMFTRLVENMNYSAQRMADVWPSRFSTGDKSGRHRVPNALARSLANRPEALANQVYAGRMGNGNIASGDGWRFIGRGLIQLTGRSNYTAAGLALDLPLTDRPELLETPEPAALASAWWWAENRVNHWADTRNWLAVSRAVNLGNPQSSVKPIHHATRVVNIERVLTALA
ncbi:glycoside hydrolase family 19 protein [Paraburkholderia sp. BR10923]|uniref:glycoside hydrolase family 19 protein n=1 Tax=Paraburkholderia sp. BR10923 TaxID=3236992 RepID=UPI0034CF8429